jgi:hypothetical protein
MANEFEIGYDAIASLGAPGYEDFEITSLLTIAEERLVKKKYTRDGNKYRKGFEGSEKRRKDLSELMRTAKLTVSDLSASQVGTYPNGSFYDLPSELLYAVSEHIITDIPKCVAGVVSNTEFVQSSVIPYTHDEYNFNIENPFKKPDLSETWRIDYSTDTEKRHELITDGTYGVSEYFIRYIKKPAGIVVDRLTPANQQDSELDSSVHREIIEEAIRYAVSINKPQEYQIRTAEQQQSE